MQYVRNISDSVSTAWNSINPATLSGAIDVIVVEQEDGTLACSPFHVRFGKFSLLRPYEKKVEFKVNGVKQDYAMKLGEGGEAFFVFETSANIPLDLQTSPLVSPASSPPLIPEPSFALQEPEQLELDPESNKVLRPPPAVLVSGIQDLENEPPTPLSQSPDFIPNGRPQSGDWSAPPPPRPHSDDILRKSARASDLEDSAVGETSSPRISDRSQSPPPLAPKEAYDRAIALSRELSAANIPNRVTETGDLMLDMAGFKSNEDEVFRAEIMARKILTQELEGNYDIGALFGLDEHGNLWIYHSQHAKDAAMKRTVDVVRGSHIASDAVSDPGYQSDGSDVTTTVPIPTHRRSESDMGLHTPLGTPPDTVTAGDPNLNYAKTLRLTSDQLKALNLQAGENSMSFTVNRATCQAYMYLWKHETPVIISDIDGTITKSDALGHVLNMIGRDWTHLGVAKLYSDIAANGYNIMYLTSRSVGQADSTRTYLYGIQQDGYRLPRGPTILSPDRTMAALRREIYLRQPQVFKMSTLRDIRSLYGSDRTPFYAGFGNRFTDQVSYRCVDVPRTRIFTINSSAEVVLDLIGLNNLKMSYVNINEIVDHYFPPVSTLIKGGGEAYTDFVYWRDAPLNEDEFSASESEPEEEDDEEEEAGEGMADSYISQASVDEGSVMSGDMETEDHMMGSILEEAEEDADDENEDDEDEEDQGAHDDALDVTEVIPTVEPIAKKESPPREVEEDFDAELITGIENLKMEKRAEKKVEKETEKKVEKGAEADDEIVEKTEKKGEEKDEQSDEQEKQETDMPKAP